MPPRSVTDGELLGALTELFRSRGFDAVSIADAAEATGLQKSSLYHRFPGGKQQMASEVARHVAAQFAELLAPLDDDRPTRDRVARAGRRIAAFYDGGRSNCLLEALSLSDPGKDVKAVLSDALTAWVRAFAWIARVNGATSTAATNAALDAVAGVEGALVIARISGDTRPFDRAIGRLPDLLLCP